MSAVVIAFPDQRAGLHWWNGLSEAERLRWLDRAWRRNHPGTDRISYTLEDVPSAADAWDEYKRTLLQGGKL